MSPRRRLAVVVLSFVALGMPPAAFGVAWPSVAAELGRGIGDLGTAAGVYALGFFAITAVAGSIIERIGVGIMLVSAGWVATVSLLGYTSGRSWSALLVAAFVLGASGGAFDAGINAFAALELDARALNLLHAGYGVGATIGPWMMTAAVASTGFGWRLGMAAVAGLAGVVAIVLTATWRTWALTPHVVEQSAEVKAGPGLVVAALALFFVYTGVELVAGQYAFTFLSEGRGVPVATAGLAAGGFWLGLTISRMLLGVVGGRFSGNRLLAGATGLTVVAMTVLWWSPVEWVGPAALLLAGLALGPIFPLHIALTPGRVGRSATARMIGYQIAAANLGAASLPWLTGRAVDRVGLSFIGPALAVGAVVLLVSDRVVRTMSGPGTGTRRTKAEPGRPRQGWPPISG
ncbi:MAG: sugar MFS transporter [Acidimicrobiia bacterium]